MPETEKGQPVTESVVTHGCAEVQRKMREPVRFTPAETESDRTAEARVSVECGSCGEGMPTGECPQSKRSCGHHCNHVWTHDECDWCGLVFGADEPTTSPADDGAGA